MLLNQIPWNIWEKTQNNGEKNFPWILLMKEFVLDLLWANSPKYSKQDWTLDMDKLPDEIKKVIYSTSIEEILWILKWVRINDKKASVLWMLEKLNNN